MRRPWSVALAGVLVVTACSGPAPSPPDAGLTVTLLQYRRDVAERRVQLKVGNPGRSPVVVDRVELRAPGLAGVGPVDKGSQVPAGQRVDLPVPLGDVRCDGSREGAPQVRLWLDGVAEPTEPARLDGQDVLAAVVERECAEQRARRAVEVAFGTTWTRVGAGPTLAVDGVLQVRPTAGHSVRVDAVEGTTLFAAVPAGLPLDPAGGTAVEVPVRFAPQRCDPHAVGESKRGYAFGVRVRLEGRDEVVLTVSPDETGRRVLEGALLERCGIGAP